MQLRAVLLAAVLLLAPLGARGADLTVWWDQGFYPDEDAAVAEIIAAFEYKTGKDVKLVSHPAWEAPDKVQAALEAGQPPNFLFGINAERSIARWAYEDRLADLTDTLGPFIDLFDADLLGHPSDRRGGQRQPELRGPARHRTRHRAARCPRRQGV